MLAPCEAEDAASLPPNLHFHSSSPDNTQRATDVLAAQTRSIAYICETHLIAHFATILDISVTKMERKSLIYAPPDRLFFFLIGQTVWSHRLWGCGASRCWKETPLGKRNGNNSRKQHTDCIMGHLHKVQSFIVPVSIYDKWMPLMHNVWTAYETFAAENWASCGVNPPKTRLEDLEISIQTLGW